MPIYLSLCVYDDALTQPLLLSPQLAKPLRASLAPLGRRAYSLQAASLKVDNPYTGETFVEVGVDSAREAHQKVDAAAAAQRAWAHVPLAQRQAIATKWLDVLASETEAIAHDISGMMGKPLQQARGEVNGTIGRARTMIELSTAALQTDIVPEADGLFRQITHEPVGVVYVIAPWNYPLMTAVNSIIPAVLAGNSVVLKHSPRTPLCGDHYQRTFEKAGFPQDLLQASFVDHDTAAEIINRPEIGFVSFTGSVRGCVSCLLSLLASWWVVLICDWFVVVAKSTRPRRRASLM
jgi:acyl-CoA reductase-like NAD-dependent aldehyde dehydrogenase